ncbi:TVP38/TMEM64 family protein [Algoriphagus namhaensis]|uniref:TVP38/TMEM64 family protein n=1 Tax=Algoriphagus namhaensis TaxID=915353 RepID=A0ABV8ANV4_9BACT
MKRFWLLIFLMASMILVFFGLAMALDLPYLGDDDSIQDLSRPLALSLGVILLAADVLLPVPSSLIMITNGALFGVILGAALSLLGATLSILIGWLLGKASDRWTRKLLGEEGLQQGQHFLKKWGNLAIIVSRPIPVLAETMTIVCGSLGYPMWKTLTYGVLGLIPTCLFYAYTGDLALSFESNWQSFALVLTVAAFVWLIGLLVKKKSLPPELGPSKNPS